MSIDFYKAFEDKFRGSRDLIKSRLQVYRPFIEPLAILYPQGSILDLGCGRGEWLELTSELGFTPTGVDLNEHMLADTPSFGANIHCEDALEFIRKIADDSQVIVSAFHFVEHIPFPYLQNIVEEAFRVLKPGGLLIMETPNPENILVGTKEFYVDPTHQRPLPPKLLSFLPEYYGFERIKIVRLLESKELVENVNLNLMNIFGGVSPDYSVVAQKNASQEILQSTSDAFEKEYGVTLEQLVASYNENLAKHGNPIQYIGTNIEKATTSGLGMPLIKRILKRLNAAFS